MTLKVIEMPNNGPQAKRILEAAASSKHRSIYLPLVRTLVPRSLEVFYFAEQGMVTGSRDATTVATQALYLLNDPFVQEQSRALAERLLRNEQEDVVRIRLAYRLALGREATDKEVARARSYLDDFEAGLRQGATAQPRNVAWSSFCQALLASAEFRFVR